MTPITYYFSRPITPDWEAFDACVRRGGTPKRVHNIEIFLDEEVKIELCERFELPGDLDRNDPYFYCRREIALQRALGYDYICAGIGGMDLTMNWINAEDTAGLKRSSGRSFIDENRGPITSWQEFESYPWPDIRLADTNWLEWFEKHLPEDMCIIGGLTGHFAEEIAWLMGYRTFFKALHTQRDLVQAISDRLVERYRQLINLYVQFERVKMIWGTDDMGFRSGTLISPDDLRALVLPGHRLLAEVTHQAGRLYLLHSCGNLARIMPDLVEDVKIDARHSFEDTIEDVRSAKQVWGDKITLLGGLDMDFMCRANETEVRARTRSTLQVCQPGGGYCLGTGNSVANYISVDNYLAMLDEGRRFA
jgi:uroporphyrinogen decarboxylase